MKLLLFDIDGTLIRSHGAGRAATRASLLEVFGTIGGLDSYQFGGKTDLFLLVNLLEPEGFDLAAIRARLAAFEAAMARHLQACLPEYVTEGLPGAAELLAHLRTRADIALGLITGNVSTTAPIKLRAGGIDPALFPVGAYGSEAVDRDDLPALAIGRAAQHYGCHFPSSQVYVIGDTPLDVQCARAAGAVAVAVTTGFGDPAEVIASQPDYLLNSLTEFLDVVPV